MVQPLFGDFFGGLPRRGPSRVQGLARGFMKSGPPVPVRGVPEGGPPLFRDLFGVSAGVVHLCSGTCSGGSKRRSAPCSGGFSSGGSPLSGRFLSGFPVHFVCALLVLQLISQSFRSEALDSLRSVLFLF